MSEAPRPDCVTTANSVIFVPDSSSQILSSERDDRNIDARAPLNTPQLDDNSGTEDPPLAVLATSAEPSNQHVGDKEYRPVDNSIPHVDENAEMGVLIIAPDSSETAFRVKLRTRVAKVIGIFEKHKNIEENTLFYHCESQRLVLDQRFMDSKVIVEEFLDSVDGIVKVYCTEHTYGGFLEA
ncbi:hypothetical protein TWF281_004745 [Arthrobotrys megalospora]